MGGEGVCGISVSMRGHCACHGGAARGAGCCIEAGRMLNAVSIGREGPWMDVISCQNIREYPQKLG